ncbi:MAG: hypothetical protein E6J88_06345 [Deltaproteobacteria bacterium]|nr:MAG: hypothetical protein E6J88_06345 [Deltaproteobacteria bacterium]
MGVGFWGTGRAAFQPGRRWFTPQELTMQLKLLKYVFIASLAASGMAVAQTTPPPAQNPPTTDQAQTNPAATPEQNPATPGEAAPVAGGTSASTKKSATEEIIVTGTRVRRKDLNTPAPVTVLSRDQITASGRVSLGEFLQALPEQGNTVNAQVNNGNDGSIYVSLRSLGSQRTLVLVNGRRMVPGGTGANSAADLSTIPAAAIERIEVLKDGASAIYGSDAISGVVNVILRKRFNGTEVSGYAGISQKGDGQTYDVHAVSGTAGDRSSILISLGYQEQRPVYAADRDFSKTTYNYDFDAAPAGQATDSGTGCFADPNTEECVPKAQSGTGNSTTFPNGRFSIPASACANAAAVGSHPALAAVCAASANKGGGFMADAPRDQPGVGPATGYIKYPSDLYNTNAGPSALNYLITPARRIQVFSTGDVNMGSAARAFFEASYVNRSSSQVLSPMPLVNSTIPTQPVTVSSDSIYNPFEAGPRHLPRRGRPRWLPRRLVRTALGLGVGLRLQPRPDLRQPIGDRTAPHAQRRQRGRSERMARRVEPRSQSCDDLGRDARRPGGLPAHCGGRDGKHGFDLEHHPRLRAVRRAARQLPGTDRRQGLRLVRRHRLWHQPAGHLVGEPERRPLQDRLRAPGRPRLRRGLPA